MNRPLDTGGILGGPAPSPRREIRILEVPERETEDQDEGYVDRFIKHWAWDKFRLPLHIFHAVHRIPIRRCFYKKSRLDRIFKRGMVKPREVLVTFTEERFRDMFWNLRSHFLWKQTGWVMAESRFKETTTVDLNIVCWNSGRFSEVKLHDLEQVTGDWDVVAMLETAETPENPLPCPPDTFSLGSNSFLKHRTDRHDKSPTDSIGGIRVFVKNKHKQLVSQQSMQADEQFLWIRINPHPKPVFIAFTHLRTEGSEAMFAGLRMFSEPSEHVFDKLYKEAADLSQRGSIVFMGNFSTHFFGDQVRSKFPVDVEEEEAFQRSSQHQLGEESAEPAAMRRRRKAALAKHLEWNDAVPRVGSVHISLSSGGSNSSRLCHDSKGPL